MKKLVSIAFLAWGALTASAQSVGALEVKELKLSNGLTVWLNEDHSHCVPLKVKLFKKVDVFTIRKAIDKDLKIDKVIDCKVKDILQKGLDEFKKRKFGMVVACAAGQGANTNTLKQITENVVQLDTADSATIKAFFKWVSASISTGSQKVEDTHGDVTTMSELPPPPPEVNIVV